MSPAEFWERTPHQIDVLWKRYADHRCEQWRPFAMLACLYANAHRKEHASPFDIEDFLPTTKTGHNVSRVQTPEQQKYMLDMWIATMPEGMVVQGRRPARNA